MTVKSLKNKRLSLAYIIVACLVSMFVTSLDFLTSGETSYLKIMSYLERSPPYKSSTHNLIESVKNTVLSWFYLLRSLCGIIVCISNWYCIAIYLLNYWQTVGAIIYKLCIFNVILVEQSLACQLVVPVLELVYLWLLPSACTWMLTRDKLVSF